MGIVEILLLAVAILLIFGLWWIPFSVKFYRKQEMIHRIELRIEELEMKLEHNICEDEEYTRMWISKLQHKIQQLRKKP